MLVYVIHKIYKRSNKNRDGQRGEEKLLTVERLRFDPNYDEKKKSCN